MSSCLHVICRTCAIVSRVGLTSTQQLPERCRREIHHLDFDRCGGPAGSEGKGISAHRSPAADDWCSDDLRDRFLHSLSRITNVIESANPAGDLSCRFVAEPCDRGNDVGRELVVAQTGERERLVLRHLSALQRVEHHGLPVE